MDLFADSAIPGALDLAARREEFLGADLDRALYRIATLEGESEALRREIAALQEQLNGAARHIAEALGSRDPLHRFPAAAQAALIGQLTVVQRRDAWLSALTRAGLSGPLFGLGPHDGGDDPLTMLVAGSGGIGDAIYLSVVVRALHRAFPAPRIVVLHDHPAARTVFAGNPYVLDTVVLREAAREEFLDHCHALDIFDLVADVRYVVTYAAPPLSRMPPRFLQAAHQRAAPWQRYVRFDWPHRNNALAREAARRGLSKLDLLGYTANLAVDGHRAPDLFAEAGPEAEDPLAPLAGRAYATIHHGAAPDMAGQDGLQTKNLPHARWAGIAAGLQAAGLAVVQLGAATEHAVPGIDLDLRGRTDLPGTARALQHASLHVDTEGGLVHLARTRRTPAIVMFGPTPPGFFGYPGNANLPPRSCGDCWWTARDWSARCPLGEEQPPCMASHDASAVLAALPAVIRAPLRVEVAPPVPLPQAPSPQAALVAGVAARLEGTAGAALLVDDPALLAACLADRRIAAAAPSLYVPAPQLAAAAEATGRGAELLPVAPGFIPAEAGGHAAACAAFTGCLAADDWLGVAAELARITVTEAPLAMLMAGPAPAPAELRAAAAARPGDTIRFVLARAAAAAPLSVIALTARRAAAAPSEAPPQGRLLAEAGSSCGAPGAEHRPQHGAPAAANGLPHGASVATNALPHSTSVAANTPPHSAPGAANAPPRGAPVAANAPPRGGPVAEDAAFATPAADRVA